MSARSLPTCSASVFRTWNLTPRRRAAASPRRLATVLAPHLALLQDQPSVLRDTFERILPELPCTPPLGFAILAELQTLQLSVADPRVPLQALLKNLGEDELDQFAGSTLPREWFVWAVCHALMRSESKEAAARYLHEDEELVRVFWLQFKLLKDPNQRQAILAALVATVGDRGAAFLDRMLASGCTLRPTC